MISLSMKRSIYVMVGIFPIPKLELPSLSLFCMRESFKKLKEKALADSSLILKILTQILYKLRLEKEQDEGDKGAPLK